jgi:SPP1 family predicted phage head-tail adaptor
MATGIDIGKFDRKISIQVPSTGKTGRGAPVKTYADLCTIWAKRVPAALNQESYIDNRLVVPSMYVYTIHNTRTVDETMRIIDGAVKYNILSVDPNKDNKFFLEITAEKITE